MRHPKHLRDRRHRHSITIGGTDGLIALSLGAFAAAAEFGLALGVLLSELGQTGVGGRRLALGSDDPSIVGAISAKRLA